MHRGAAVTSCTTPVLTVGRYYYVSVVATNAAGISHTSARIRVLIRR